jgi:hypothetical protein
MSDQPLFLREPPDAIRSRIAVSGLQPRRYRLVAPSALSYGTRCRLVDGGRSAIHGASTTRFLGGCRGVALVHLVAAARAAGRRIDSTAIGCARTLQPGNTGSSREGRHANPTTHHGHACDADTEATTYPDDDARSNTITNSNTKADGDSDSDTNADCYTGSDTHANSDANPDSRAPDVQPCLRHRDGKRGVEQPDW